MARICVLYILAEGKDKDLHVWQELARDAVDVVVELHLLQQGVVTQRHQAGRLCNVRRRRLEKTRTLCRVKIAGVCGT